MIIDNLIRKYGLCFKTLDEGIFVLSSTIPLNECEDEDADYIKKHSETIVQYLVEEKLQYSLNMGFIDAFFTYFSRERRAAPLIYEADSIIDGEYDGDGCITLNANNISESRLKAMYQKYDFPISRKIIEDAKKNRELLDEDLLLLCEKTVNVTVANPKKSESIVAIALREARAIAYDRYLIA